MTKLSKLFGLLLIPVLVGIFSYKTASAFFNDTETSINNVFTAAATFPDPSAKPSSSPHPSCGGNVVISGNSHSINIADINCFTSSSSAQINNSNVNNNVVINNSTGSNTVDTTNNGSNSTTTGNSTIDVNISNNVNH